MAARPVGSGALDLVREAAAIRQGFEFLIQGGLAQVEVCLAGTVATLHQALMMSEYDVLHFMGHGEFDDETKTGFLLFEDAAGAGQRVNAKTLRQALCQRGLRLVFLNACETGRGGAQSDFNRGVAPALISGGIPAVVANQYKVLDVSATAFAEQFYRSLARGLTLGNAAREARVAVNYSMNGECIDWAVPVVYARNPMDAFCNWNPTAPSVAGAVVRTGRRRAPARDTYRVALWEVNPLVGSLVRIAESLNDVQDIYSFDVVVLSAPLGTWRLKKDAHNGGYLVWDEVFKRLEGKARELGMHRLVCITSFQLEDDYYLLDEDPEGKLSLFSAAHLLDQLSSEGVSMERAVANVLVACLSNLNGHARRPKDCPLYFNEERDVRYIGGSLKLCKSCRQKIRETSPLALEALERMLDAFP